MSISRRIPKTVKEVVIALFRGVQRSGVVAPADQALSTDIQTALTDENTAVIGLVSTEASKKYAMVLSTNLKDEAKTKAKNYVNAYFQGYNNGITLLGVFNKESRILYGLAENDSRVPNMGSEADILYWGGQVTTGDAARVAAGGAAMSNPTAAEVTSKVGDFNTKNNNQGIKKTDFSSAQADTTARMPDSIKVVVKVWDSVETFYDQLTIEARRAKAREWGVVYESTELIIINVTVKNSVTGALLAGAVTTVLESGTEHTSNGLGEETIETHIAFGVTLETVLDTYVTNTTPVEFTTGVTVYNVVIEMVAV